MTTQKFNARTMDGKAVVLEWTDKGDVVPGIDAQGNRFEALTTHLAVRYPEGRMEAFSQVPLHFTEPEERFRAALKMVHKMGVDPDTIDDPAFRPSLIDTVELMTLDEIRTEVRSLRSMLEAERRMNVELVKRAKA